MLLTILLYITTGISLLWVAYQDFKERKVYSFLFLISGGLLTSLHISNTNLIQFLISSGINLSFIGVLLTILMLFSKIIFKKSFNQTFGWGDLLFFIVMALSFPTITFLVLFSFSLFFSLLVFLLFKSRWNYKTVPLAGLQALFVMGVIILNKIFSFSNLYMI
ncbi:hypothetical protein [Lutibacter sp.]